MAHSSLLNHSTSLPSPTSGGSSISQPQPSTMAGKLAQANEAAWFKLGNMNETMGETDQALFCYENCLRHNSYNTKALAQVAFISRQKEQYAKAADYFQRILNIENTNGEVWGALGHCYLLTDDLQKAYTAYQQALYHLSNPKDPSLWYGIGILYERYGSHDHAEEAFHAVLKMDPKFEKAPEIQFRLGVIYKQQPGKLANALECFLSVVSKPPSPLTSADVLYHIGSVYELLKELKQAQSAYEKALKEVPTHAKVLQQLGWLYHTTDSSKTDQAIVHLSKATEIGMIIWIITVTQPDPTDGQAWYLLGRCYMSQQKYRKAYDAYQQAVYRDSKSPQFWCSIGVLYYQIGQYRDSLDAYTRAIRLSPYLSEVWYNLGTLYEACNQMADSLDAFRRAAELDPNSKCIQKRLAIINSISSGSAKPEESEGEMPQTLEPSVAPPGTPVASMPQTPGQPSQSYSLEKGKQLLTLGNKDKEKNITEDKKLPEPADMKERDKAREQDSGKEAKEKPILEQPKSHELAKIEIPEDSKQEDKIAPMEVEHTPSPEPPKVEEQEQMEVVTRKRSRKEQDEDMGIEEHVVPPTKKSKAD